MATFKIPQHLGIALLITVTTFISGCVKHHESPKVPCSSLHPVIFIHGFLASGDTWANQVMRFSTNGYCDNLLYVYDWNSVAGTTDYTALDSFVNTVLAKTGATQVDLVGHSAGGGYGYGYCNDSLRSKKVAHYVHLASSSQNAPAGFNGNVPTLNISSPDDMVAGVTTITGATNIQLTGKDHYQVATSEETFGYLYKFFNNNTAPATTTFAAQSSIFISGRSVTLGNNSAISGGSISIYEVNPASGARLNTAPDNAITTDVNGNWGPVSIKPNTTYEFEINTNISGDRVVHYYRQGFTRTNPLVYLRTIPPSSSLAGSLLAGLSNNDDQTVLAEFTANQAVVAGRDSLSVADTLLSTSAITPASASVIAMFLYDANDNHVSDMTEPTIFTFLNSFLTARDMYFPTSPAGSIKLRFNGQNLFVPNLKSHTDGIAVAVFD